MHKLLPLILVLLAMPAFAIDGLLEINAACAVQTGCFTGDEPGYPVTISGIGLSYRLTSNLSLPDANTTGILIQVALGGASIDLNGFLIGRPVASSSGTGDGIAVDSDANFPVTGIRIRNGTVFGVGRHGLKLGEDSVVENVSALHNGEYGIEVGKGSIVKNSIASHNGGTGILVGNGSNVSQNNTRENGGSGIFGSYGSVISGNTSYFNQEHGIHVTNRSIITGNNSNLNRGYGLYGAGGVGGDSTYRANMISGNILGTVSTVPVIGSRMVDLGDNYCNGIGTCP